MNASDIIALLNSPALYFIVIILLVAVVVVVIAVLQGRPIEFYGLKIGAPPPKAKPELAEQKSPATPQSAVPVAPSLPSPAVALPVPPASPKRRQSRTKPKADPRQPAIVIVEDEPDMLIILHRLMRDLTGGYDVVTCTEGADVLAQVAIRPVSLVITDYSMPGMNGLQLTQAIKETSPETKVVFITAYATPQLEQRAREAGADYYLPKPYPLDRLEYIVRDALG